MNKRSEVSALVDSHTPHILALTEFGAAVSVQDGELGIEDYSLYRGNHSSGEGGLGKGVALYIKNNLNHSACPRFDNVAFDCSVWCTIQLSDNKRLLVGVVYRSPNSSDTNNQRMLEMLRIASTANCDYLMVCGDFNVPKIDWQRSQCHDSPTSFTAWFMEEIEQFNWFQHSINYTRFKGTQKSCLDLIFTNEESMVDEVLELPPLGKSDHACQIWEMTVREVILRNTNIPRPNFKKANWTKIKEDVRNLSIDQGDSASDMMKKMATGISDTKKANIPACKPRSKKHRLPWMKCAKIKRQKAKRWRCWTKFRRTGLPRDYDAYKLERNLLNSLIREAKMKYERKLVSDMKDNPNLYHGHCRRSLKTKTGVTNVVDEHGVLTETEDQTSSALNKYYHSVFTKDGVNSAPPPFPNRTQEQLTDVPIMTEKVEEVLLSLNPNKAAGPDGIENRILKECAEEMAPKLQQVFRKSIDSGDVPDQWREAHIVPIHKGGSKAVMGNFRPVALTSAICKVLEKIVCATILSFLTKHNLITPHSMGS